MTVTTTVSMLTLPIHVGGTKGYPWGKAEHRSLRWVWTLIVFPKKPSVTGFLVTVGPKDRRCQTKSLLRLQLCPLACSTPFLTSEGDPTATWLVDG
jgi:hypothetical protein